MIQAIHCVAVFSLDVEHKEEDGRDAVKTEVRFLLCSVFFLGLSRSFTLARGCSFLLGVNHLSCHKLNPLLASMIDGRGAA